MLASMTEWTTIRVHQVRLILTTVRKQRTTRWTFVAPTQAGRIRRRSQLGSTRELSTAKKSHAPRRQFAKSGFYIASARTSRPTVITKALRRERSKNSWDMPILRPRFATWLSARTRARKFEPSLTVCILDYESDLLPPWTRSRNGRGALILFTA